MTSTETELRECLTRLIDRVGEQNVQTRYPALWRRIQIVLVRTEES